MLLLRHYWTNFTFMWPCIITNFFVIKPTRCTNLRNLLRHETLHVSGSSSVHHQEFIHCTLSNCICHTGSFRAGACARARKLSTNLCDIPLLSVQWINSWWWTEELPETRRVSCRSKFGRLVHLVGFITKKLLNCFRIRINLFLQHWIFASSVQLWTVQYKTPKYIISIMVNINVGVRGRHDDLSFKIMLCKHFWTSAHSRSTWCFCLVEWVTPHAYLHILNFNL